MELESLAYSKTTESGSGEYQEINKETTFSSLVSMQKNKSITENDFFIQVNNVKRKKVNSKKRKAKKKLKLESFLSTISSELLTKPVIEENVIRFTKKGRLKLNYEQEAFKKGPRNMKKSLDIEAGRCGVNFSQLDITFPNVLENVSKRKTSLVLQYIQPKLFQEIAIACKDNSIPRRLKFLDIHIQDLCFIHHHEFTLEILLGIKLETMYEHYEINKKILNNLQRDIDTNRRTRTILRQKFLEISPDKREELRFDTTILKYTKIMLELKEKYLSALKNNRKLVHYINLLWTDIETIRLKNGHITAPQYLDIIKQETSEDELNETWMQIFEQEYSDMLIKVEYEFVCEYLRYKELKTSKERKDVVKPKLQFNSDKIKDTVHSIVADVVNMQNVEIKFRKNENSLKKLKDHNRKHRYFIKVYVDNVFVCESEKYFCTKFANKLQLTDTITIEIIDTNKNIKITLYENEASISDVIVNLNEINESIAQANFTSQNFVYDKLIAPTCKYVGSGYDMKTIAAVNNIRLTSSNLFKGKLFTNFDLGIKVGWNIKTISNDEQVKSLMDLKMIVRKLFLEARRPTVELLSDLIGKVYEKNVAKDVKILDALKRVCKDKAKTDDHVGNTDEKLSTRLRLLYLRNTGKLVELDNEIVPLVDSQISTEQLSALTNTSNKNNNYEDKQLNPIDLQRYLSVKYVTKLNNNLLAKLNGFLMQKTYKDVVRDFEDLNIRNLFSIGLNLNLSPPSALIRQQVLRDCLKAEQEIRVTVIRAHNLLDRTPNVDIEESENSEDIAGFKMRSLRPFLRVSYHSEVYQTPTAIGCHPTWNHTIVIKSKLEPLSCININIYDEYRISIVDPTSEQSIHQRRHTIWLGTLQIPLRSVLEAGSLTGAFKISTPPFTFGYNQPSKENKSTADVIQFLKTDTPFILMNITTNISHLAAQSYGEPMTNNDENDLLMKQINVFTADYLNNFPSRNLSLTFVDSSGCNRCIIEFLQPLTVPEDSCFPRDPKRNESGVSKGSAHSKSSSSKSSRRKSIDGNDVSPFSRAGSWTKAETQSRSKLETVIRYVSLIPTYEVLEAHAVTLTGMELLKILYGSPLDHTLLLASYFIFLGVKCYVIMGWGLPRRVSSYVLVKFHQNQIVTVDNDVKKIFFAKVDGTSWYVYDAVAGQRYDIREIGCPLKTVSHVFDTENIWVNMQSSQECGNVSMDLTQTSDWQPVFKKPPFLMKPVEALYTPPNEVEELRIALENKIKNKIQKWRSHSKTLWNRYCSGLLRETLTHWEYWAFNPENPRPTPGHRLKQLMVTYKIWGFPLNTPYANPKQITSRVKSTAIHVNDDPNVEFGLAVEVFPYPNNVLSVWVYLASIVKINE